MYVFKTLTHIFIRLTRPTHYLWITSTSRSEAEAGRACTVFQFFNIRTQSSRITTYIVRTKDKVDAQVPTYNLGYKQVGLSSFSIIFSLWIFRFLIQTKYLWIPHLTCSQIPLTVMPSLVLNSCFPLRSLFFSSAEPQHRIHWFISLIISRNKYHRSSYQFVFAT